MQKRFTEDQCHSEPAFQALVRAFLSIKTGDDMEAFLRDVASLSELQAMSERLEIAKQLARGLSYRQVAANTGASTTTVTRVSRSFENGKGGYRKLLAKTSRSEIKSALPMDGTAMQTETAGRSGVQKASALRKYLEG